MFYENRFNSITAQEAEDLLAVLNVTPLTLNENYQEYIVSLEHEKEEMQKYLGIKKPSSSAEIAALIQEEFPGITLELTPTGKPSITKEWLMSLAPEHTLIQDIIKLRQLAYKVSHYPRTNTLQPQYKAHLETTGRIYSKSPNIQGLPELYPYLVGDMICKVDFAQQELNLLAKLTGDKELARDLATGDLFGKMAAELGISRAEVKTNTYAGIYGNAPVYRDFHERYPIASSWLVGKTPEEKNYPLQHWGALYMYDLLEVFDGNVLVSIHDAVILQRLPKSAVINGMKNFDIPYEITMIEEA